MIKNHAGLKVKEVLTTEWIKNVSGESFKPGQKLLRDGGVIRARLDKNVLRGRVLDGTVHQVGMRHDPEHPSCDCTCLYAGKVCKHGASVLLYTSNNLEKMDA